MTVCPSDPPYSMPDYTVERGKYEGHVNNVDLSHFFFFFAGR